MDMSGRGTAWCSLYLLSLLWAAVIMCLPRGFPAAVSAVPAVGPADVSAAETATVPPGVPVLMYHSVGEEKGNDAVISRERFQQHMAYLYEHHYHTITLDELYAYLQYGHPLPARPVVITFDDGYRDTYETALPILRQYGFKGVLFIPADEIGRRLTQDELLAMRAAGWDIDAHSYTHRSLSPLSAAEQEREIARSKAVLDQALQQDTRYFCYPNGSYDPTTLRLLQKYGFVLAVTTEPGWARPGDNLFTLPRVWLGNEVDLDRLADRLARPDYPVL